ncbi:MAG TPA: NAD(P)/FAD-dependent oxidoreductase [Rhodanobacteraceae bacterium]|jgi:2-polyprenyl-6-methoxyphenol hydroxylase-like FAD-dependent oxidoreductase|nr:NAD(P)/FAD-dependent oxidoreductase [Rhodanobacteraceae bacterium]
MANRTLNVAVVGYGTAGQAAAILLSRDGHRVEVFEQAEQPGPVGAGFLLQPVGLHVLWEMGLLDQALAHGARIERLHGETANGRAVMDMCYAGLDARLFGLGMQRGALFSLLAQAWPNVDSVHRAHRIVGVDAEGRRIRDAGGREFGPYDLVLAADGAASCLRAEVGGVKLDRPYPWGALWCLLPQEDWQHAAELRQRYVAARKMIGLLPVGTRPGDATPRLSFFWSLRTSQFDQWQQTGISPWLDDVATLWPQARALMNAIEDCSQLRRASYRDAVMRRWSRGRLVLLGDAAHAMSPQLGQGVNMALMDALSLRDALRAESQVETAIARHVQERRAHVRVYQFWSRWLTPLFQSDRDLIAKVRDLAFLPLGRMPVARGQMLRVLSGLQRGAFGRMQLPAAFLERLASCPRGGTPSCALEIV